MTLTVAQLAARRPVAPKPPAQTTGSASPLVPGKGPFGVPGKGQNVTPKPKTVVPKVGPRAPAATGPLTPQQIVDQSLAELRQQINDQYTQQNTKAAANIEGLSKALIAMLNGVPAGISADYNQALGQQQSISRYGSEALAAANPNASAQQTLQAIGAPASQQQAITDQNNAVFQGGAAALYGMEGAVPGQQIAQNELAQLLHARSMPGIAALQAQQGLSNFLGSQGTKQSADLLEIAKQRLPLIFQAQGIANQNSQLAFEQGYKTNAAKLAAGKAAMGQFNSDRNYKLAVARYELSVNKANAAAARAGKATIAASKPSSSWSKILGYVVDGNLNPLLGSNGKPIRLPGKPAKNAFTPTQIQKYSGVALTLAGNAYQGFTDAKGNTHVPLSYSEALLEAQKEGIPIDIAVAAMNTLYQPGQRGRPVLSLTAAQIRAATRYKGKH